MICIHTGVFVALLLVFAGVGVWAGIIYERDRPL